VFVLRQFVDEIAAARDVLLEGVVVAQDGAVAFHGCGAGDVDCFVVAGVVGGGVREREGSEAVHLLGGVAELLRLLLFAVVRKRRSDELVVVCSVEVACGIRLEVLVWVLFLFGM